MRILTACSGAGVVGADARHSAGTGATAKVLDPLYELEHSSEEHATAGLAVKSAAKSVCVNRPPSVHIGNPLAPPPSGPDGTMTGRVNQDVTFVSPGRRRRAAAQQLDDDRVEETQRSGRRDLFRYLDRHDAREVRCGGTI